MKIALVHDSLVQYGGAEKTLKALSEAFPDAPIYTSIYNKEVFHGVFTADKIHTTELQNKPKWLKKRYKWLLPFLPSAFESLDFSGFDVVISSSSSFAKGIVTPLDTIHINYCHTPTRFLWDSTHSYFKDQKLSFLVKFIARAILHWTRVWDKAAADRVDYFIANSKNVSQRIQKYYRRDSTIINPPVEIENMKVKEAHADFFLIVSRLEKYKNVEIAIKAFNQIPSRKLIIIGEGNEKARLEKLAGKNIQFLGHKNDQVVQDYYQNCQAFIATARDEDFGITPVEAMGAGKPVLAIREGGFMETIIENETGIFYEEHEPKSLLEGLVKLMEKTWDPQKIREHAEKFDTKVFQEKIKKFVEKVTNDNQTSNK